MARETEEGLPPVIPAPSPALPKPGFPEQIGGVTRGRGAPYIAPPSSSAPSPPRQQGGLFPSGPMAPPISTSEPSGPPAISPPSSASQAFLPPNFQSQLGQAGFFSGPGASPDSGLDPQAWLKNLFGSLTR